MKETNLTVPQLVLMVGTRVAAGVGVGLLLSEKMDRSARRAAGVALLAVGVLSTIPLAAELLGSIREGCPEETAV